MRVLIVGARFNGYGGLACSILRLDSRYELVGFVDDDPALVGSEFMEVPVLGTCLDLAELRELYNIRGGIVAVYDPFIRERLSYRLVSAGYRLVNAIHRDVSIDDGVEFGYGNMFCSGVRLISGVRLGHGCALNTGCSVDHDCIIGDYVNISPGVHLAGRVEVGDHAVLGTGASIIPDISIGKGSLVGAGSVIIRNVGFRTQVQGVPGEIVRVL